MPQFMLGLGVIAILCVGLKHGSTALALIVPRDLFVLMFALALAFLFAEWGTVIGVALTQLVLVVLTVRRSGTAGALPAVIGLFLTAVSVALLLLYGRNFEAGPLLFDMNYYNR